MLYTPGLWQEGAYKKIIHLSAAELAMSHQKLNLQLQLQCKFFFVLFFICHFLLSLKNKKNKS